MDVNQQKYRKTISTFKTPITNIIYQYPISDQGLPQIRNLKYLVTKQQLSFNIPFENPIYEDTLEQIKIMLQDKAVQRRMLGIRLARVLPFIYRVKLIQLCENELMKAVSCQTFSSGNSTYASSTQGSSSPSKINHSILNQTAQFHYQITSDMAQLCLSIYQISHFSDDIYFDINQRILTLYQKLSTYLKHYIFYIVQNIYHHDKNIVRNCYEALRSLFLVFGYNKKNFHEEDLSISNNNQNIGGGFNNNTNNNKENNIKRQDKNSNKLINKIINLLVYSSSFVTMSHQQQQQNSYQIDKTQTQQQQSLSSSSPNQKLRSLILHTRQFQIRVRSRLLLGLSYLLTYLQQNLDIQIYQLLINQIFIIAQNCSQCDVHLDCFASLRALLSIKIKIPFYIRNQIIKKWAGIIIDLNYKKQYWEYFIQISKQVNKAPKKLKYNLSIALLETTANVQKQFSRFLLYKSACKNLMEVARTVVKKQEGNILLNIFLHSWFIDRINQQNDLFRSQFLICLLHAFFQSKIKGQPGHQQVHDLIGLCHRLLDWKCSCKQQTHIPTIKFAFDLYLIFLKKASTILKQKVDIYISQLIQRCNQQNIYFLFKLKLISTLIKLPWYKQHWKYIQCKLNLDFLQGQIKPFMMPRNPKPIFSYQYSLTNDGQIQSRKQIDYIKIIMGLLTYLPQAHDIEQRVSKIAIQYNNYLNDLESASENSNRDLIHCLLTLQADNFFSECQRNFLLSLIDQTDCKGNNYQYTLSDNIVYSPYQQFQSEEDINVFGTMSPLQLTLRVLPHSTYSSVFLLIKKSTWIAVDSLKLVVSSGIQKKELPFQSSIIEMKIDRVGALHFQVWRTEGQQMLLGSGKFKLKRNLKWKKIQHLNFIDGIRTKAYFKNPAVGDGTYLSYYYGQPVMIQAMKSCNEVVVTLSSRQIWNQMQQAVVQMVQQLTDGSATIIS